MRYGLLLILLFAFILSYGQRNKPVITGQQSLATNEEQPITIRLNDLTVVDPDDWWYPWGFSLTVYEGFNYTVSGTTVTPSLNFTGALSVPVSVSDGRHDSDKFNLVITVNPVNDPPVITAHASLSTVENTPLALKFTDFTVSDPDNVYPNGFTLNIKPGSNYTVNGTSVVPNTGFTGTLNVDVTMHDGTQESQLFRLAITVIPANKKPSITGQQPVSIISTESFTIQLSHLTVTDPDNTYPNDFTLSVSSGSNYTVIGNTIKPTTNFTGTLSVPVTVNDGKDNSTPYNFQITVNPANQKPVITGQVSLASPKNTPITIDLTHLTVADPDNPYPTGFTLSLSSGANYTVSGNVITPNQNFIGILSVPVIVNDGNASSDPFTLKIEISDQLMITGQRPLEIKKNEPIILQLTDLIVNDPTNTYPTGFSLQIKAGANYTTSSQSIVPTKDYIGQLSVPVTVSKGGKTSNEYNIIINVLPANSAPEILSLETDRIRYEIGSQPISITSRVEINDTDDQYLELVEIGFRPETYRYDNDELIYKNVGNIRGVFDPSAGKLTLLGQATLLEYRDAIRSVKYNYTNVEDPLAEVKKVYIKLSDGKTISEAREREILLEDKIELDIPNGFTPNNDKANDTWKIKARKNIERFDNAVINIYDKRGVIVYQAKGLGSEWDGTHNGKVLPPDTYYYVIDLQLLNSNEKFQGIVTILR